MTDKQSLKPLKGANRKIRRRLTIQGELLLALLPTITILGVLGMVEVLSRQRLLFASLASSAFLIYLDPQHGTNGIRTLITSQMLAATLGFITYLVFGPGYIGAGIAMIITIILMIILDVVHPPAVSTSLSFALRAGNETNIILFALALAITSILVLLQRCSLWLLARYSQRQNS
ncbi:HPP family protein [Ancylothrix sp. C2]|uniref:HPP family protein n=1 Tax=Ancylothrix sp. D3o TaxID=2953691 RepID=UPI0021BB7B38|nr:HPP family protein [Ancylothrix sp. D3o]MCT7950432.1 HPP family protein [Ancylothrix sp. D3o]